MLRRIVLTALALVTGFSIALPSLRADQANLATTENAAPSTRSEDLQPGPNDGAIAFVTARELQRWHYRRDRRPNDDLSELFFAKYTEALDPQRLYFTQKDLADFASYRTNLDNLTFPRVGVADTEPAYKIFNRFRDRVEQRVNYALNLLTNETFVFDTDDQVILNRKDEPHPADLDAAHRLWEKRLRSEYLQEKIAKYAAKKKKEREAAETTRKGAEAKKDLQSEKPEEAKPAKTDAEEIVETLTRRYTRNLHYYRDMDQQDVLEIYLTSLAHCYDPHTDYFNPRQAENFAIGMNLSLIGIGAVLQTDMEGYCKIVELKPGPAMKSGKIKPGDRIVAVAQSNQPPVDVVDMNVNKIVPMVRGPEGTEVRLTVIPPDNTTDRREVALIREEIKLEDQAAKAKIIDYPTSDGHTNRIGVIDLPTFYVPMDTGAGQKPVDGDSAHYTSKDVARLLAKLKEEKVEGVILDLRRNGGGSLEECIKLTGLFIKDGPVVQVSGPYGPPFVDEDKDSRIQYDGPLIVLTSRFSASASEILAGALQDYGRALIVGDLSTHGKGTVQQLNPLRMWIPEEVMTNNPGTLKITKAKFYRASGASTQLKGVMSDIVLPSKWNYAKDIGEEAYDTALPWDTIESARYEKFDMVQPSYIRELQSLSSQRLGTNQDFAYIRDDIEQFRKQQALNTLSLSEARRIREWEEDESKAETRDKELRARKPAGLASYEITLKDVDRPGLPTPEGQTNLVSQSSTSLSTSNPHTSDQDTSEDLAEEDKPPVVDPTLSETERILIDYINLLDRRDLASKTR